MSIRRIDSSSDLRNRLLTAAGAGGAAGTIYSATKKNWLYNNSPSDVFVRKVSDNLEQSITPQQRREASIINSFVRSVVDPEADVQTLKPQIRASKELTEAIKSNPAEDVEAAIERVFAEPDTAKLKDNLINLQSKTQSDKLFGKNTALKLVYENYDSETQSLRKAKNTSEQVFKMIKSTAKNIQIKSAVTAGLAAGAAAAALTFLFTDTDKIKR